MESGIPEFTRTLGNVYFCCICLFSPCDVDFAGKRQSVPRCRGSGNTPGPGGCGIWCRSHLGDVHSDFILSCNVVLCCYCCMSFSLMLSIWGERCIIGFSAGAQLHWGLFCWFVVVGMCGVCVFGVFLLCGWLGWLFFPRLSVLPAVCAEAVWE